MDLTSSRIDFPFNLCFPVRANAMEYVVDNMRHHHLCRTQPVDELELAFFRNSRKITLQIHLITAKYSVQEISFY